MSGFNRYDPDFLYRSVKLPDDVVAAELLDLAVVYGRTASTYEFIT